MRIVFVIALAALCAACAHEAPPMVWVRLDGQRASDNPVLVQQFETDRTICFGKMQQANLSGVAVYQGGIYGAIAMQERAQATDAVARGCMAEKGYTFVPLDQAETKRAELAAINAQKQAQAPPSAKTAKKK